MTRQADGTTQGRGRMTPGRQWLVVMLLFLVQLVNYADKSVVGLAAKPIMQELGISAERYGLLAASFFSLYAVTGLLVAFLVAPKYRPGSILSVLLVIWALAQLPVVFASSFTVLVICRVVLGMGEGAGAPTALNASHEWFPPAERDFPAAIVMFGSLAGSLIAAPGLSYVIAVAGWRAAFLACCALSAAIFVLWFLIDRPGPYSSIAPRTAPAAAKVDAVPMRRLWSDRTVIGNVIVGFCAYWIVGFSVAWLAPYVSMALGYDLLTSGWILAAIYAAQAVLLLSLSYVSQVMLRRGVSSRMARGGAMALCLGGSALSFGLATLWPGSIVQLIAIAVATGLSGVIFPLSSAMLSEVAPDEHRNSLITIAFSLMTLAAIASPLITGRFVAAGADGWASAFIVHGMVALLGGISAIVLLHPESSAAKFRKRTPDSDQR